MNEKSELEDSPNQQTVSDDDEIDYSSKPEFYDPKLDDNDELWARKQRRGRTSDAVLSCPACFTTICLDCQRFSTGGEVAVLKVYQISLVPFAWLKSWRNSSFLVTLEILWTMHMLFLSSRHERYVTQYRAIFVVNCRIKEEQVSQAGSKRKRNKRGSGTGADNTEVAETFKRVCCSVCSTDVGVIDEDEVYHFLNVIPSEA